MKNAVDMHDITVRFGQVVANSAVEFHAGWSEIHGLVGENGAGKTTLMRVLYGMYTEYDGELCINGEKHSFSSPKDAIAQGIGMVHQHFSLVPSMTVAENVVIGKPPSKRGLINLDESIEIVKKLSKEYGLNINPKDKISDLTVGLQQRVEILKALYLGAEILIMDEPTAVLTPQEIKQLMKTLIDLKNKGKCIILITHKLAEVKMVTDKITVLRNGTIIGNVDTKDTDEKRITNMMVGREVVLDVEKESYNPGKVVLDVHNISCLDKIGLPAVKNISLQVHEGEVVGIAGVQGNGQHELADAISGLIPLLTGEIVLNGKKITGKNPSLVCRKNGMGHIHDDRVGVATASDMSIRDNFLATIYRTSKVKQGLILKYSKADDYVKKNIKKYKVKIGKITDSISSLSGGNMQKLIIAREMFLKPSLLIASQPTRGVDVGAQEFIYQQIIKHRDSKNAVLLISNELSEILALSDRILIIYKGEIIGELNRNEANEEKIGLLMAGIKEDDCNKEAIQ
ncbi:ABC transporter ATP-binding protein [Blautia liquoris]|nr:ABC transporter ATP-binding protein [Blautia liquoris]